MEKLYFDPQELTYKFRSKSDLWMRMSIDCKSSPRQIAIVDIFLPSYSSCTISFMKNFSKEKKYALFD